MSNEKKFEPAFPMDFEQRNDFQLGMSKRFYAACAAMNGILSNENVLNGKTSNGPSNYVRLAYRCADELLKQENE